MKTDTVFAFIEALFYTYKMYDKGPAFPYVQYLFRAMVALLIGIHQYSKILVLDSLVYTYILFNVHRLQGVTEKERDNYKYFLALSLAPSVYRFILYG